MLQVYKRNIDNCFLFIDYCFTIYQFLIMSSAQQQQQLTDVQLEENVELAHRSKQAYNPYLSKKGKFRITNDETFIAWWRRYHLNGDPGTRVLVDYTGETKAEQPDIDEFWTCFAVAVAAKVHPTYRM